MNSTCGKSSSGNTLQADESLLIYSDGFETAFPDPGSDEHERKMPTKRYLGAFDELASDIRSEGPQAAMDRFSELVDAQDGSLHQVDDITVMTVYATADTALDQLFRGVRGADSARSGSGSVSDPSRARRA